MRTRTKPLMIAVAFALGASAPAFAQSSGTSGDTGNNSNSMTSPNAATVTPTYGTSSAPVVSGTTSAPVVSGRGAAENTNARSMRSDEDSRERAARAARATKEEEHGGLRNRVRDKKERTREKLGLGPDKD